MGGNIVDEDGAGSAAVIRPRDGPETFCAGRVPELELNSLPPGPSPDLDDLACKLDADRL